ncbi:unnamed protein product [Phaeothamnion confervicola]
MCMASGDAPKGFGKAKPPAKAAPLGREERESEAVAQSAPTAALDDPENARFDAAKLEAREAIKRMEREREERQAENERRLEELREAERYARDNPDAGVIPEVVANRMLSRMVPFFFLPVLSGIGLFVFYFVLAKKYELSMQPTLVAFSTQAPFVIALLGISYAIVSTSWDPEREGSFTGVDEFKTNIESLKEGLARTGQRQEIREEIEREERRKGGKPGSKK